MIQNERLKMTEGGEIYVGKDDRDRKLIDTSRVNFVFLGTFAGIKKEHKNSIGFSFNEDEANVNSAITRDTLLDSNMLSNEFLGRINGGIIEVEPMDEQKASALLSDKRLSPIRRLEKQYKIDNICGQFGIKYILFKPDYIKKAYDTIFPKTILPNASYDKSRLGLFDLVSAINGDSWFWSNYEMSFANIGMMPPVSYDPSRLIGVDSPLINIARWINNSDTQFTYNELIWTFWLYSPTYQITILHKYFSDVSNNQTKFDINLFKKLYNNDYVHLGTFWRYLYEPFKSNDNKIKVLLKSILKLSFLAGNNISITEEQVRCILNIINKETL
jgi:hypothetical protein